MILRPVSYKRPRFPTEIIAHAVWLHFRFPLSLRLAEGMLLERGIVVSYETIRRWAIKFGADYAGRLKRKAPARHDIWHLNDVVIYLNIDLGDKSIVCAELGGGYRRARFQTRRSSAPRHARRSCAMAIAEKADV